MTLDMADNGKVSSLRNRVRTHMFDKRISSRAMHKGARVLKSSSAACFDADNLEESLSAVDLLFACITLVVIAAVF